MPLRICFVSSEVAPLAKSGGLADVSGALSRYLDGQGHDLRLIMPLHSSISAARLALEPVAEVQNVELTFGSHHYRFSLMAGHLPESRVPIHFVHCPALFDRPSLYTSGADEHLRFLMLSRAALESCQRLRFAPQILHCNDWHTALLPLLLRTTYAWDALFAETRTLLTIHNIGYQGIFPSWTADALDLGANGYLLHQDDLAAGKLNWLKHGVLYADRISTVSPTYAWEISTAEGGHGLDSALQARPDRVVGILNGVDYEEWDPAHDLHITHHYSRADLSGKARTKREFLDWLNLPVDPTTPLLGVVSRMTAQKGLELLFGPLPDLLREEKVAFVALGSGEWRYEEFFTRLQHSFPGRVVFHRGYHEQLAHLIEAASDMFLMPSRYEPCGLNQMYSLRYGTVPIVRRTGGLADTVHMFDPGTGRGTGIVFDHFDAAAMRWALDTALALYRQPEAWQRLMLNGMACDFSWSRQGAEYVRLYQEMLGLPAGVDG